jgi:predicted esterase YcpF (UPF0227 family)
MSAGILYLHGFCSSPESWKAQVWAKRCAPVDWPTASSVPALSPVPNEAIAQAEAS